MTFLMMTHTLKYMSMYHFSRSLRSKADPNTLHLLSAFYYNSGMFQKAADASAQLLSIDPSHQDGIMTHVRMYVSLCFVNPANEDYEQH